MMPLPAHIRRQFYSARAGWPEKRAKILARAGDACEECRKPNHTRIETFSDLAVLGRRAETEI